MSDASSNSAWRVGVDTGGTFTDAILADPQGRVVASCKVLSTPDDPGRAVLTGIDRLLSSFSRRACPADTSEAVDISAGQARRLTRDDLAEVVHGSTVATNALLETKTDAAALVTTAGFEDVLLLARQNRPELYALSPRRTDPPIARGRTLGVNERIAYDGSVLTTLTQHEVDRVINELKALRVDAVAVCLLHSYANDAHERKLADAIRASLPGVHLTVSSVLLPELREYERTATCAANAVVAPRMARYIGRLDEALGKGRLRIMASGGGTLPPRAVIDRPVETVMSGPAGGVIGAWAMANQASEPRIIGFDMGGTSTDVTLCDQGPTRTNETAINGLPIRLPMIDIHTVGAGGGSIAWIDDGGALRVGPQSAGADPGPACYGRQGENPCLATVTDAHAVLGHLRDGRQLGDALAVDTRAARHAVGAIAQRLGLSVEDAAEGILRVADAAMARAIQRVSVQRGHDARAYTLLAFGGAGGLHACRLADVLGMTRVLVPVHGGLLSAFGMLAAPPRYALSHAVFDRFEYDGVSYQKQSKDQNLQETVGGLARRGLDLLRGDGIPLEGSELNYAFDMRFEGQSYEITVQAGEDRKMNDRFVDEHKRLYGYAPHGRPIEVVAARVEVKGRAPAVVPGVDSAQGLDHPVPEGFLRRESLTFGESIEGPAIIEEYAATTVVPAGWSITVLDDGQILLENTRENNG